MPVRCTKVVRSARKVENYSSPVMDTVRVVCVLLLLGYLLQCMVRTYNNIFIYLCKYLTILFYFAINSSHQWAQSHKIYIFKENLNSEFLLLKKLVWAYNLLDICVNIYHPPWRDHSDITDYKKSKNYKSAKEVLYST